MEHSDDHEETKSQYFSTTEYSGGDMYAYNSEAPPAPKEASKRPVILSVICVLAFIAGMVGLMMALTMDMTLLPEWYKPYAITGILVSTAGYVGIWNMKLWGLYILAIMFVVALIVGYNTGVYSLVNMGGSALILLICVLNSGKMD